MSAPAANNVSEENEVVIPTVFAPTWLGPQAISLLYTGARKGEHLPPA
jgi:hypothetical protein